MSTDPEDLLVSAGGAGEVLVDGDVVVVVAIKKTLWLANLANHRSELGTFSPSL